ncbi:rhomboid family intramembrane serine protease [Streptococcus sp. 10F2]
MMSQLKYSPVTCLFVALNVFLFLMMYVVSGGMVEDSRLLIQFGALYPPLIQWDLGQSYRLLSAIFVHIGFMHFFSNTLTLYFLGQQIERLYGSARFFLIYLLTGLMGNLFCLVFSPEFIVAGSSTSIYGLFTILVVLRWLPNPYLQHLGQSYLPLLVMNLVFSLAPGISLAGHLGGLLGGACLALSLPLHPYGLVHGRSGQLLGLGIYLGLSVLILAKFLF